MNNWFTNGFYKFLLGFSIIILVSFGVLFYLGLQNDAVDERSPEPESQLAQ